jgi:hypothetical protein
MELNVNDEAVWPAIKFLITRLCTDLAHNDNAPRALLQEGKAEQGTIDRAVREYLLHCNTVPRLRALTNIGYALDVARLGASRSICEELAREVIRKGMIQAAQGVVAQLLDRELTAVEVKALVEAYVTRVGTRSAADETVLLALAKRTLAPEEVVIVDAQIADLVREFERIDHL